MLCHQKRKLYADRLRQLNRLGLAMPFEYSSVDNQTPEIVVEQAALGIESPIIDLRDGRTLYLVWLSLVAKMPGMRLYDYRFVPPWPDRGFQTLPSFADSHIGEAYVLPGKWEYPREDVLNLRFGKTGWRLPCTPVEGLLAALSDTPIPEEHSHGSPIPAKIEFFSKSGRQVAETTVTFWTDRLTHHENRAQHAAERLATKPAVAVDNSAAGSIAARQSRSTLYDGGEVEDSRPASWLGAKALPLPGAPILGNSSRTVPIRK